MAGVVKIVFRDIPIFAMNNGRGRDCISWVATLETALTEITMALSA